MRSRDWGLGTGDWAKGLLHLIVVTLAILAAPPVAADYSTHPKAAELLQILREQHHFSDAELDTVRSALKAAQREPKLIEKEQTAKEKTLTWTDYRPIHVNDNNIRKGAVFLREYAEPLARAEREYGVAPEVIAAILGVETKYGGYTGPHRVLDSLSTQGFEHPTRANFFFDELVAFFVLCRDDKLDPTALKGSYAGAMGAAQFMPSNYLRLGVDFDHDGRIDLWNPIDAIGSIANYLNHYRPAVGWQRGGALLLAPRRFEVRADQVSFNQRQPNYTLAELARLGAEPTRELPGDTPAGLLELQRAEGREFWIALNNFYAVMSYNPRVYYAMAVAELARGIAAADAATRLAAQ